jgi:hypothetical protein
MKNHTNIKTFLNDSGTICLRTDGIITFCAHEDIFEVTDDKLFYNNIKIYKELTNNGKKPFLADNRKVAKFTVEQKKFMKEHLPKYFTKVALIMQNNTTKFMLNSFLYLYRPEIEIKGFVNQEKAIEWLLN